MGGKGKKTAAPAAAPAAAPQEVVAPVISKKPVRYSYRRLRPARASFDQCGTVWMDCGASTVALRKIAEQCLLEPHAALSKTPAVGSG